MQRFESFPQQPPYTPLLDQFDSPSAWRSCSMEQLDGMADELRALLLHEVGQHGGHLGAGLGVIELTLALHYCLDTPDDRLVWDVGHQAYPHKLLTGRRNTFSTLRRLGGLAPFPSREESEYDTFGVGHAGTAVSAAVGMALANRVLKQSQRVCAVIGDGALSCGMSMEALSHAGAESADILVVLNDNGMSISPNVGAVAQHLPTSSQCMKGSDVTESAAVNASTEDIAAFFRTFGFAYSGPVNGHDMNELISSLISLNRRTGPRLLHVVTHKGAGFLPAESDSLRGHAYSLPVTHSSANSLQRKRYEQLFGEWAQSKAATDKRMVAITPAMREGSGLVEFAEKWPERFFDVAIAEQHALTLAAGMATEGAKPVVAIYSTFLQRGYDQLIHDIALQRLDVTLAVDRAGLVGEDGPTHHGAFDLGYLRLVPGLVVMAPANGNELHRMLEYAYEHCGPCAVRYPRGMAVLTGEDAPPIEMGRGRYLRHGKQVAILNFGALLPAAMQAAEQLNASIIDMRFVKPLDTALLDRVAQEHELLVTLEDGSCIGGAGSGIAEALAAMFLNDHKVAPKLLVLGLPDHFVSHGTREELLALCGLDAKGIVARIVGSISSE